MNYFYNEICMRKITIRFQSGNVCNGWESVKREKNESKKTIQKMRSTKKN